jgi:Asp-tRNA(Asn)/Glu-tRNA(Gln) amidotransferase A subunit family amidase
MSLHKLTVFQLREGLLKKSFSPREILDDCVQRIQKLDTILNAFPIKCFEKAYDQVKKLDQIKDIDFEKYPLFGIPVGVKDLNDIKDVRTTQGSRLFENYIPTEDDNIVSSMRENGALFPGKTNVPEHGFGATTTNDLFGTTNNPYSLGKSCGASSGGTAVSIASQMVPLAMGSDFAGSLRTPASFCNIVGMRPSVGFVPTSRRGMGWSPFDVEGPMARNITDLKILLSGMVKNCNLDPIPTSFIDKSKLNNQPKKIDLKKLKIAISYDLGFAPMSKICRDVFDSKINLVSSLFESIKFDHPEMNNADKTFYLLRGIGFVNDFSEINEKNPGSLGNVIVDELKRASEISIKDIGWAMSEHTKIFRNAEKFFENYDLLITPAASVPPFNHEDEYPKNIDSKLMDNYLKWEAISYGVTLFGGPSIVIPCGSIENGLPFGIQIISKKNSDIDLLDIAYSLENSFKDIPSFKFDDTNYDFDN